MNKNILPLFIFFLFFISCNQRGKSVDTLFVRVGAIVEQYPDSALALLDSIHYPKELNEGQYAEYVLLLVQAKDKAYQDIASDTIIFLAREYFQHKNDPHKAALANFYCGRVFQTQENNNQAMEYYLKAESYAGQTADFNLRGLIDYFIGDLYFQQYIYDEAIIRFKRSNAHFSQSSGNYKKEIDSYNSIGNAYFVAQQNDSAFHYYNEGLKLAELHNDSAQQAFVKHGIGVTYRETGDLHAAKKSLVEALNLYNDDEQRLLSHLSLAGVYHDLNRGDSARFYTNQVQSILERTPKTSSLANFYLLLSQMEEKNGNYKKAMEHHRQYAKHLSLKLEENRKRNVEVIEKKYNSELERNERQRLLNEWQWVFMAMLFLIIIFGSISFYLYRKHVRNKAVRLAEEVALAEERATLVEANQIIFELPESLETAAAKENTLRNLVLDQFDIYRKAIYVERYLSENGKISKKEFVQKINEVLYGQEEYDWEKLYQTINEGYNGFFCKLKNQFSQLNDNEYRICCLTCAGIDNSVIGIMLKWSKNTIQQRKSEIRQKLNMPERGDMKVFFEKELNQTLG